MNRPTELLLLKLFVDNSFVTEFTIEQLLKQGADLNIRNEKGWTLMELAISKNNPDLASEILRLGATVTDKIKKKYL